MHFAEEKQKAAMLSIISNTILIFMKLSVGLFTNSISILSEAAHSLSDLLASFIAYFSVKQSSTPPDKEHPFGHGKYEDLSGFIEGILIIAIALFIVKESVDKIIFREYHNVETFAGIVVMFFSVIANIFISRHLFKVAKKTESMAIHADAEHLRTDVLTSAGIVVGLVLIQFTGIYILDPIVAILVSILIFKAGLNLCATSGKTLLDSSLPEGEQETILEILKQFHPYEMVELKEFKSRKSGADKLIELTFSVPGETTIETAHELCDRIELELKREIGNAKIIIHIEPCSKDCSLCKSKEGCQFQLTV